MRANSRPSTTVVACAAITPPKTGGLLSSGILENPLSNIRLPLVPFIEELEHAEELVSIVRLAVTALVPETVVFEIK
jgi:hypothetical protein